MSQQLYSNLYNLTEGVLQQVLELYDGKVVGSEEMTLELLMETFLPDGKKGKKKKKKVSKDRPLSGYQYYQQVNKTQFNSEMEELVSKGEEKPKYVAYVASKWKELSDEEKSEWSVKAKESVSK
jgi:hypothetical protein